MLNRFEGRWTRGFEIADAADPLAGPVAGYRVRRVSDGAVLPVVFPAASIRADMLVAASL